MWDFSQMMYYYFIVYLFYQIILVLLENTKLRNKYSKYKCKELSVLFTSYIKVVCIESSELSFIVLLALPLNQYYDVILLKL